MTHAVDVEGYLHHRAWPGREPVLRQRVSPTAGEQARELFTRGIRRVVFTEPVALAGSAGRDALDLLRELGAWGVRVEWTATEVPPGWEPFGHLPPPRRTSAAAEEWHARFHPGKCVFRQGPGFLQVRDRRSGVLDCYTIEEPHLQDTVHRLAGGADPRECDPDAVALFAEHGLLVRAGSLAWWAPARLRRWPVPAMVM
ncbi:DUF5825 family protein [Saccharopolyspora rhizosphaerae]|uniref:DUF5825 family protein n=1 Tax=Saccharopolyspora rhizosphaerae TaxID=2492662 RepID=UPI0013158BA8|nr:DUF5825 family protein [Saccharopolyspora rhizosphaerae]